MPPALGSSRATWARGQDLIEFAILFPLLALMLFGAIDLGRVFFAAITVANAAREGARYAMLRPTDLAGIQAAAQQEADGSGIDLTDPDLSAIEVTCPSGCTSTNPIQVTVSYRLDLMLAMGFPSGAINVSRSAVMMLP